MLATKRNTTGECHRCGKIQPYVLASGFYEDGSFRMLCSGCDRIERDHNQLKLYDTPQQAIAAWLDAEPEPEEAEMYEEPEPPQMSLF